MKSIFYNAQHSPIGAFASFTLGAKGASGGLGAELGHPANQSIYVGAETVEGGRFQSLPFFKEDDKATEDFVIDSVMPTVDGIFSAFADSDISRTTTPSFDTWKAGDLTFRVINPVGSAPDPRSSDEFELKMAYLPAVIAELTLDNSAGKVVRKVFFGSTNGEAASGVRHLDTEVGRGFAHGRSQAVIGHQEDGVVSGNSFSVEQILAPVRLANLRFMLGGTTLVVAEAQPGEVKTVRLAICFHRAGLVTTGLDCSYFYASLYPDVESVADFALNHFEELKDRAEKADEDLHHEGLNESQRWMLAMAIKSYFGSSQLLLNSGVPLWMINEGEYRMMNTFDLTVDQAFFEMRFNPWTVANVLDQFTDRYSYRESLGGHQALAFTHDMGVANQFSSPAYSCYELAGLTGCFSYMSHEELVNWVLCAGLYVAGSKDSKWLDSNRIILSECLASLELRDSLVESERDGVMSVDSTRCEGGWEITTYDSLDASLGQARASSYLGLKTSAAYAIIAALTNDPEEATRARSQALLGVDSILKWRREDGAIPALLEGEHASLIIPVIEGLVYFDQVGLWDQYMAEPSFAELVGALEKHLDVVLTSGICLFPDGGWKLSSTSGNSWLSKIYLCQHIARKLLKKAPLDAYRTADEAHVGWLLHPESLYWAWSDQMVNGVARGSKYYPRGVTSILWLSE